MTLSTQYTYPASVEIGISYEVQVDFFNPAQAGGNYVRIDPGYFRYPDGGAEIITLNPGTISFDIAPQSTKTFHFRMEFYEADGVQYEKLTYWLTDLDGNFTQGDKTTVNVEAGYNTLPTVSFTPANADQHIVRSHSLDFVVQSEDEKGDWAEGKEVKVIMDNYIVSQSRVDTVSEMEAESVVHYLSHHEEVAATCTEAGNIEYWSCSVCGKNFSDAEGKTEAADVSIPATGHTFGEWQTVTPATCTAEGTEKRVCACGEEEIRKIPIANHTLSAVAEKAPTAEESGNIAYWTCTECGVYFSDAEGATEGFKK